MDEAEIARVMARPVHTRTQAAGTRSVARTVPLRVLLGYVAVVAAIGSMVPITTVRLASTATALLVIAVALRRRNTGVLAALAILYLPIVATVADVSSLYSAVVRLGVPIGGAAVALVRWRRARPSSAAIRWFPSVFVGALVLASIATVNGRAAANAAWSRPLHLVAPLGGFALGYVCRGDLRIRRKTRAALVGVGLVAAFAFVPGAGGHAIFLLAAGAGAAVGLLVTRPQWWIWLLIGLPVVAWFWSSTLTVALIAAAALVICIVIRFSRAPARTLPLLAAVAIAASLVLTTFIAVSAPPNTFVRAYGSETLRDRVEQKIWGDRGPLLSEGMRRLERGLDTVGTGGRTIVLYGYPNRALGFQTWANGLHNVYLESFFQLGWLGGSFMLAAMFLALAAAFRGDSWRGITAGDAARVVVGASTLGLFAVGSVTGQFLIEPNVGTWFWLGLGLLARPRHGIPANA